MQGTPTRLTATGHRPAALRTKPHGRPMPTC